MNDTNYYYSKMKAWEYLQKRMIWKQLEFVSNMRVLDFGSGRGFTADYLASNNEVVALEPFNEIEIESCNKFVQLKGDIDRLIEFEDNYFDIIICHNVFEYVKERSKIMNEFKRLLKKDGILSIVKHNRKGRVMQKVVLENDFEHARNLMQGENGQALEYGDIHYYDIEELLEMASVFSVESMFGIRTFWHLQQEQYHQDNREWQENMLSIEHEVSGIKAFQEIASFHHILFKKIID